MRACCGEPRVSYRDGVRSDAAAGFQCGSRDIAPSLLPKKLFRCNFEICAFCQTKRHHNIIISRLGSSRAGLGVRWGSCPHSLPRSHCRSNKQTVVAYLRLSARSVPSLARRAKAKFNVVVWANPFVMPMAYPAPSVELCSATVSSTG